MPIENELKFVLRPEIDTAKPIWSEMLYIIQSYLPKNGDVQCRIRSTTGLLAEESIKFELTIKTRNIDGTNTEIEIPIIKEDYAALLKKCSKTLVKIRGVHTDGCHWVFDKFLYRGSPYFYMAEVEMPEGKKYPDSIPEEIAKNIIYAVGRNDNRFSSEKLENYEYATRLYKELMNENTGSDSV